MSRLPLVLVSADIETKGKEFGDLAISLSENYQRVLINAGLLPLAMPSTRSPEVISEAVRRSDGVVLTGGDDIDPRLYRNGLSANLRKTIEVTPDGGGRDFRELMMIDEVFRQRKPLLAICRGHQIVNVALGGTLIADIQRQMPGALNHRCLDRKDQTVHEVRLTPDSVLFKIIGRKILKVNSTHHQALGRVAPLLKVAATSSDGVVESTELRNGSASLLPFFLTVQFHPERLANRHAEHQAIFREFARACATKS